MEKSHQVLGRMSENVKIHSILRKLKIVTINKKNPKTFSGKHVINYFQRKEILTDTKFFISSIIHWKTIVISFPNIQGNYFEPKISFSGEQVKIRGNILRHVKIQ